MEVFKKPVQNQDHRGQSYPLEEDMKVREPEMPKVEKK